MFPQFGHWCQFYLLLRVPHKSVVFPTTASPFCAPSSMTQKASTSTAQRDLFRKHLASRGGFTYIFYYFWMSKQVLSMKNASVSPITLPSSISPHGVDTTKHSHIGPNHPGDLAMGMSRASLTSGPSACSSPVRSSIDFNTSLSSDQKSNMWDWRSGYLL